MVTSTTVRFARFNLKTSKDTPSATFSQVSEAGASPSKSQASTQTPRSGPDPVPASRSAVPEKAKVRKTRDTSGQNSEDLSKPVDLQSCLENKLRQKLEDLGASEYVLRWKHWDMDSGLPICALRASTRRTSDKDSGGLEQILEGWRTPDTGAGGTTHMYGQGVKVRESGQPVQIRLCDQATASAGWPTTAARDHKDGYQEGRIRNGKISTDTLNVTAALTSGWPTATAGDSKNAKNAGSKRPENSKHNAGTTLVDASVTAGWATPQASDPIEGARTAPESNQKCLGRDMHLLTGWLTPSGAGGGMKMRGGDRKNEPLCAGEADLVHWQSPRTATGWPTANASNSNGAGDRNSNGQNLQTVSLETLGPIQYTGLVGMERFAEYQQRLQGMEKPRLNPFFSLWLMGYPRIWGLLGLQAMIRSKRSKPSKKRQSTPSP